MDINYLDGFNAWEVFKKNIYQRIGEKDFHHIAELGAGANPLLTKDFIERNNIHYHLIDISHKELAKVDELYEKKIMDLSNVVNEINEQYDFVFAQMTLEHIKDPKIFYENIYRMLKPGGECFFFFACITNLPMLANFIVPESISGRILLLLQPFRKHENHGKFKAYYRWCFGPTPKNIKRLNNVNFEILSYTGFFGHSYYQRIPVLTTLEKIKTRFLLRHPTPFLCTYAHVLLRK